MINYKEEVLKQFPNAELIKYKRYNSYNYIKENNKSSTTFIEEHLAWQDFYEKYCKKLNKNNMQLTRKDFEGLEVGTEINVGNNTYYFQFNQGDIVFVLNKNNYSRHFSIHEFNEYGATIQKPKEYNHLGWEIGDYSGKNVWVKLSTISLDNAFGKVFAYLLKSVNSEYFVTEEGFIARYAVQLTEVNTQNMKVK